MENPENKDMVAKAYEVTQGIFDAGVNCVRMNFSHGTYEEQGVRVKIIKDICAKKNLPISMLLDTKGPEIRLCDFEGEDAIVHAGSTITIECLNKVIGNSNTFSVTDSTKTYNMAADVKVGAKILVDDGKLQLVAESVNINDGIIIAKALNSHKIKKNKRINLPGANYTMPFVSQKDKADLVFACENHFDYVAASFVNSALNVKEIRDILDANGGKDIKIIAKIESTQGIKNLKEIVQTADGIMVARGDLGLEISYYEVPY
jgi:pyruvate kinase